MSYPGGGTYERPSSSSLALGPASTYASPSTASAIATRPSTSGAQRPSSTPAAGYASSAPTTSTWSSTTGLPATQGQQQPSSLFPAPKPMGVSAAQASSAAV
eukprot:scaffold89605_cov25-Prasinocladus_malaysianus.AAC.1